MGKINMVRVVLGGIAAGLVINVVEFVINGVILKTEWSEAAKAIGRSDISVKQIVAFNVWGVATGILAIWLYAAIRPRFGAGPKTAMWSGLFVWILGFAMANGMMAFLHIYPLGLLLTVTAIALPEVLVASVVGAYLYKED